MKRRLVYSSLAVVVLAVLILGLPLLVLARHEVWSSADKRLNEQATTLGNEFEDRLTAGHRVALSRAAAAMPDERVIITRHDGIQQTVGPALTGDVRRGSVRVGGATITVVADASHTIARVRTVTLEVIGLALLAAMAAVTLGVRQARHLSAPLAGLADRADALGRGDFTPTNAISGIAEIDHIADQMERSARRIGELVALQAQLASDAAHQLRTPLTGIGLRLEEIIQVGDPKSRTEAEAALVQVERLDGVVTSLLARARGDAQDPITFEMAELVRDESAVWGRVLRQHDRHLAVNLAAGALVNARRDHVRQVLAALLENALSHGEGTVSITVVTDGDTVTTAVADEGPGVAENLRERAFERSVSTKHGTGIGLSLARSLAEGEGGSLQVSPRASAELQLRLPVAR